MTTTDIHLYRFCSMCGKDFPNQGSLKPKCFGCTYNESIEELLPESLTIGERSQRESGIREGKVWDERSKEEKENFEARTEERRKNYQRMIDEGLLPPEGMDRETWEHYKNSQHRPRDQFDREFFEFIDTSPREISSSKEEWKLGAIQDSVLSQRKLDKALKESQSKALAQQNKMLNDQLKDQARISLAKKESLAKINETIKKRKRRRDVTFEEGEDIRRHWHRVHQNLPKRDGSRGVSWESMTKDRGLNRSTVMRIVNFTGAYEDDKEFSQWSG